MELQDWRKEPRKKYSNEFKLRMVELASQPGACVAQIARENGVNDNVIFKWLRLWQNEGRNTAVGLRLRKMPDKIAHEKCF
ncbi:TPA: transposase [Escherichia coli]